VVNIHDYIVTHQRPLNPVRRWGLLQLDAADFGGGAEPMPDTQHEIAWRVEAIRAAVALAQADRCAWDATKIQYQQSMKQIMDVDIGPIDDLAREIGELNAAPKAPGPTPQPPPAPTPRLAGVYGTYSGHGQAVDLYGGRTDAEVQWGPHHGLPLVAPVDGRVEVYQIGTPLSNAQAVQAMGWERAAIWHALADGWTCWAADPLQTMYVAVFWPSAPLVIEGQRIGHLHYGHVLGNIQTGVVTKGEQFAITWDSGIRFEPSIPHARAAHVHCAAGAGTALSPNGDLPGRLAAVAQGWALTPLGSVPGPQDYLSGRFCAGRLLRDFHENGKVIPPMPA
jgi:hypothetical protein